ncbi:MAG: glutathione S-transferase [Cyanobacteria bacterium QH_3_48_40]|nr:MAG: glutathione S-transferase [Cyanobacteria bacterium QH_3_48_40]
MLKLDGGALTRAFIVEWYLEEISVPYQFVQLDMRTGAHLQTNFLAINPMGKLPALVDGNFKLWESGAILLYLSQKYGQFPEAVEQQAEISQWIFFANATLIPGLFTPQTCDREYPRLLKPLDEILQLQPFLLGKNFSLADVAVGAVLAYIPLLLKLDLSFYPEEVINYIQPLSKIDFHAYPAVESYIKRLGDRPDFQKTIGAEFLVCK